MKKNKKIMNKRHQMVSKMGGKTALVDGHSLCVILPAEYWAFQTSC